MVTNDCLRNTVIIRRMRGLGNQMCHYGAALGVAIQQSQRLLLDLFTFESYKLHTFQLDCLNVPQNSYVRSKLIKSKYYVKLYPYAF